jgi:peptidoglycan/xylan/chitin deacetylase (PgdA/CDA1 family)
MTLLCFSSIMRPVRVFWRPSLFLLGILFLLPGCRSINQTREQLRVPENTVVFSFDDGPNGAITTELLDVLQRHNVKAVFCLLGVNAEANPETVRRIRQDGHVIVNHGRGNPWAVRLSRRRFSQTLLEGERLILLALDEEALSPRLYRPHGGFYTNAQRRICQTRGYTLLGASARAYDAVLKGSQKDLALRRIMKRIEQKKGGIILLHDARDDHSQMEKKLLRNPQGDFNRSWIPGAVEELIIRLEERGYRLTDIDFAEILAGEPDRTRRQP